MSSATDRWRTCRAVRVSPHHAGFFFSTLGCRHVQERMQERMQEDAGGGRRRTQEPARRRMQEDDDVAVQRSTRKRHTRAALGPHSGRTRAAQRRSSDQQPSPLSNIAAARIAATPAGHAECSEWSAATVFTCSAVSSVTRNFPSKDVLRLGVVM